MKERLVAAPPPLIEDLHNQLRLGSFEDYSLAQTNDFRRLQMDIHDVIDRFPSEGDYKGIPNVSSSVYLRQAGQTDDDPRFRLITDPSGNLDGGTSRAGQPQVVLRLEQGQKNGDHPGSGKIGSWLMEVAITLNKGAVSALVMGTQKTGRRSRHVLLGSSPAPKPVKVELLDWIRERIGDPDTLVPAPTPAEAAGTRFLGGLAVKLPRPKRHSAKIA